jgi:hypothetical protein
MTHWSFFYLTSLGIALANSIIILCVFGLKTQDGKYFYSLFSQRNGNTMFLIQSLADIGEAPGERVTKDENKLSQILPIRAVYSMSLFLLLYVGIEVTMGGVHMYLGLRLSTNTYTIRLDSHFHHERTTWWSVIRVCIVGFLWR